jgi:polar amino acid transport system substrate-binding protein
MTELVAAGVPGALLQNNLERWKALQLQPEAPAIPAAPATPE